MKNGRPKCKVAPSWAKLMAVVLMFALLANSGTIALAASEDEEPLVQQTVSLEEKGINDAVPEEAAFETGDSDSVFSEDRTDPDIAADALLTAFSTPDAVTELAGLTDIQRQQIMEIWARNGFGYNSMEEMANTYCIEGVSKPAAYLLLAANTAYSFQYICDNYTGESAYLEKYIDLMTTEFWTLVDLTDAERVELGTMSDILLSCYSGILALEQEEADSNGESLLMNLFDQYRTGIAIEDANVFLNSVPVMLQTMTMKD